MKWPDLREALRGIPWAVAGAVATRMYMPERATQDLDIVVLSRDAAAVRERLRTAGYALNGELTIGGSTWTASDGTSIDVIESNQSWLEDALAQAQSNRDPQHLPVLPLSYLVLMKLQASRAQDVADVTRMLGGADDAALGDVRAAVGRYAADLADDLESLIALGQLELRDPERRADRA
ncbi:MAG: hypothetical protein M3P30_10560 [Chloroflexota bacterium]|nr:hypothetical protein [Chloroflexota bacterium]